MRHTYVFEDDRTVTLMAVTVDRVQPNSFFHSRLMETGFATMVVSNTEIKWKCEARTDQVAKGNRW